MEKNFTTLGPLVLPISEQVKVVKVSIQQRQGKPAKERSRGTGREGQAAVNIEQQNSKVKGAGEAGQSEAAV